MSERTDEVERDPDEVEAQAAIEEAQSVLDDVETSTGTGDSGGLLGGGGSTTDRSTGDAESESSGGILPSLSMPSAPSMPAVDELFSARYFGVALIATTVGMFGGGAVVPFFDKLGGYVGLFGVTFLLGALSSERHYFENVLAAMLVTGGVSFLTNLQKAAFFEGFKFSRVLLLALGIGFVVSLAGTYLGRDLRQGVTRDVGGGGGRDDDVPEW